MDPGTAILRHPDPFQVTATPSGQRAIEGQNFLSKQWPIPTMDCLRLLM